ncbi:Deoxyguanosinetriphosphate triphosphohydrolase-like protein [Oleispira antarctica RB-8]|uniref:Deoxyguanosinetriphosphate triphosphohydrolase-like protein n=1 Tax=Oleispira antarctica RB-8 TaxID=698738 RepID=R4YMU7_OLEAN|nr:Deoxyguanosinetriphosphate triphosphohydrolase-like protein [Oleispira antarctica RB-8]
MMDWTKLLQPLRVGETSTRHEDGRSPFHKDQDRIIFSSAFRRLDRKTQVHPLSENDHVHNRLTHSLEVSCVGRSLGFRVAEGLKANNSSFPESITPGDVGAILQAACLAHDIGNPPYGHTGEDAIRHWFLDSQNAFLLDGLSDLEKADLRSFEGNAQGFRLVTQVEYHRFSGGMRLTQATLGTFLKYPWTVEHASASGAKANKFGCFQSEFSILKSIASDLGLIPQGVNSKGMTNKWCRHPLVYLMEIADDICYGLIDLEDGIEMGILRYSEVEAILKPLLADEWHRYEVDFNSADNERRRLSMLRGKAMEKMVVAVSQAFLDNETELLAGTLVGELSDHCPDVVRDVINNAKSLARERIFKDPRKTAIEVGAYSTLANLLTAFLEAAKELIETGRSTYRNSRVLEMMGPSAPQADWTLYQAYMRVLDYVAGMTDNYAADTAQQFSGYSPPGR